MARTLRSDKVLFWTTLVLVSLGIVMVYSASGFRSADLYLWKQVIAAALGLVLLFIASRVDYHEYRRPAVIWSLLGGTAVLLCAVFFFEPRNDARRWLHLPGFSAQPSELAKLAITVFTAALIERRMHRINDLPYATGPVLAVMSVFVGLILLQPDLGTSLMIVFIVGAMLFAAGLSYRYLAGAGLLLMPAILLLAWLEPYRWERLTTFVNPWADRTGDGYQIIQSLIAFGSGGAFGLGLAGGMQKSVYLPEAHTDFIFAAIGEELGLVGTTAVLLCFSIIAWRGLRIAVLAPDRFGAFLAIGLTTMIALQGLMNMSVNISIVPNKGIPLPLVSSGGTSLIVNLIAMGVLLNISQRASPLAVRALEPTGGLAHGVTAGERG